MDQYKKVRNIYIYIYTFVIDTRDSVGSRYYSSLFRDVLSKDCEDDLVKLALPKHSISMSHMINLFTEIIQPQDP